MERKIALRTSIRQLLRSMDPSAMARHSAQIRANILDSQYWKAARVVGLFAALGSEPMLDPLLEMSEGRIFCFPRILGNELQFYTVSSIGELRTNGGKLREPAPDPQRAIPIEQLDLLIVPGIAFTRDGHRLGRGGGFYDRLLASEALRGAIVGTCYEQQVVAELPMLHHDRPVQALVTEAGLFRRRASTERAS